MTRWLICGAAAALIVACTGEKEPEVPEHPGMTHEEAAEEAPKPMGPQTFADQVKAGGELYGEHCASCHGDHGEGTGKAPRVVGVAEGALPLDPPADAKARTMQFHTAADVAGFVVKNMPANKPGSLKEHEYWSILAFDLHANGVELPNKLDATNAGSVVLHK
ncbi:MAG: c-type cytochrome [Polyangiaceae bacterium]|nr:c-type cytochrome [Polyangiaceae bacterium]